MLVQSYASAEEQKTDCMEGSKDDVDRYSQLQFRTGSLYFPNTPLTNEPEMLFMTNHAFGRIMKQNCSNNVSLSKWVSSGHAMPSVDLERSSLQMLSAIPLNTSRVLSADVTFKGAQAVNHDRRVNIWLEYVRICRTFIDNISVEE